RAATPLRRPRRPVPPASDSHSLSSTPKRRAPAGPQPTLQKGERNMKHWLDRAARFLRSEDGPTAVEYAVMLALIVVVCIAAISALGSNASATFGKVGSTVNTTSS